MLCGLSRPLPPLEPTPPPAVLLPPPLLLLLPPLRHSRLFSWFLSPRRLAVTCGQRERECES